MTAPMLFATCPVPACRQPVSDPREVCGDCLAAFGEHLRPSATEMSAEDFAAVLEAGSQRVAEVLAERRVMPQPSLAEAAEYLDARGRRPEPERKRNQRCWCCEERRTCTRDLSSLAERWICDACAVIT